MKHLDFAYLNDEDDDLLFDRPVHSSAAARHASPWRTRAPPAAEEDADRTPEAVGVAGDFAYGEAGEVHAHSHSTARLAPSRSLTARTPRSPRRETHACLRLLPAGDTPGEGGQEEEEEEEGRGQRRRRG
eukprot:2522823-Prymnesium_polylepis.1